MSQTSQGARSTPLEGFLPVKRKRGRPRKDANMGLSHPSGVDESKRRQHYSVVSTSCSNDVMIGTAVFGVLDGSFDAGYLLTVRAGNAGPVMRGVVFDPGLCLPVTSSNDVAPHVKMIKRNDIPLPVSSLSQVSNPVFKQRFYTIHNKDQVQSDRSPTVLCTQGQNSEVRCSLKRCKSGFNQVTNASTTPLTSGCAVSELQFPMPSSESLLDPNAVELMPKPASVISSKAEGPAVMNDGKQILTQASSSQLQVTGAGNIIHGSVESLKIDQTISSTTEMIIKTADTDKLADNCSPAVPCLNQDSSKQKNNSVPVECELQALKERYPSDVAGQQGIEMKVVDKFPMNVMQECTITEKQNISDDGLVDFDYIATSSAPLIKSQDILPQCNTDSHSVNKLTSAHSEIIEKMEL